MVRLREPIAVQRHYRGISRCALHQGDAALGVGHRYEAGDALVRALLDDPHPLRHGRCRLERSPVRPLRKPQRQYLVRVEKVQTERKPGLVHSGWSERAKRPGRDHVRQVAVRRMVMHHEGRPLPVTVRPVRVLGQDSAAVHRRTPSRRKGSCGPAQRPEHAPPSRGSRHPQSVANPQDFVVYVGVVVRP